MSETVWAGIDLPSVEVERLPDEVRDPGGDRPLEAIATRTTTDGVVRRPSIPPIRRRIRKSSAAVPNTFTTAVERGIPTPRPGRRRAVVEGDALSPRFASATTVGIEFSWTQAEEAPVQHQHRAVEHEPGAERREAVGHGWRLPRLPGVVLEEQPDDRLAENRGEDARRDQQKCDLADPAGRACRGNPSTCPHASRGRVSVEEEHGCDRDREDPLREHVVTRNDFWIAVGASSAFIRREANLVDHGVHVDQAEAERDEDHQHEGAPLTIGSRQSMRSRGRSSPCSSP